MKRFNRAIAMITIFAILTIIGIPRIALDSDNNVKADTNTVEALKLGAGSIANGIPSNLQSVCSGLPTLDNSGTIRFTTDNYNANFGTFDTNNWGTCGMWDYFGTATYTGSIYTYPMAYRASSDGMGFAHPATRVGSTYVVNTLTPNGTFTDFFVQPEFETNCSKVDNITDWTYDMVLENKNDSSQYLKTTMTQASPFGYFQLSKSDTVNIVRKNSTMSSSIIYYNGSTLSDSTYVVVKVYKVYDSSSIKDQADNPDYDYYAFYIPNGSKITQRGNSANYIGTLKVDFPSESKAYMSVAWLAESDGDNTKALEIASLYEKYAYNFITDTVSQFAYDEKTSTVTTTFNYIVDRKTESKAEGTIMGIFPHQYKNIGDSKGFLSHTARTLRGEVKYREGSSFTTKLTYSRVLPFTPDVSDENKETLQGYVDEYMSDFMPSVGSYTMCLGETTSDPYVLGKQLNRATNVLRAAEVVGDSEAAERILDGIKGMLELWFTYSPTGDSQYFAYHSGIGSLLSCPTTYDSIKQMNDHHFHYGYFIQAAAQVGLRDAKWLDLYAPVVEELIDDIACTTRNSATSRYPYLRNFSPFQGHSWASGFEDPECGNNQESTSEAMHAWYGIILYGAATGNDELRDLGIYLYTTESSAIENYWLDVDGDVLDDNFDDTHVMASLVFGGKYDYATWFSADPAMVQGIQLLPMTAGSYYLCMDKAYMQQYINYGNRGSWNDIWSEYVALMDPDKGMDNWSGSYVDNGESKAHTFQYIKSLQLYGLPDKSITSDASLSSVFVKDGKKTYMVYNDDFNVKTFTFSDGVQVTVNAREMATFNEEDLNGQEYYVDYYKEDLEGNFDYEYSAVYYGELGAEVTAKITESAGFEFDKDNVNNIITSKITSAGTRLKVYYKRSSYNVTYQLNGGTLLNSNVSQYKFGESYTLNNPVREGYQFAGWYSNSQLTYEKDSINADDYGDITFYARWKSNDALYISDDIYITFSGYKMTFHLESESAQKNGIGYYMICNDLASANTYISNSSINGFSGVVLSSDSSGGKSATIDLTAYANKYIVFGVNVGGAVTPLQACQILEGSFSEETTEKVTSDNNETTIIEPTTEEVTTQAETTGTIISGDVIDYSNISNWTSIGSSDISYSVIETTGAGKVGVLNTGSSQFFYMPTGFVPNSLEIVGPKTDDVYTMTSGFAGAEVRLEYSLFDEVGYYKMTIMNGTNSLSLAIKSGNPVIEAPTEEETTVSNNDIVISDKVKVEGYQISATYGGNRVVASIEPTINNKHVEEWGLIYALASANGVSNNISEDDMVINAENPYIISFASTALGTLNVIMGESTTATYFVRTMQFPNITANVFEAEYYVRAYGKLTDGSYVYSQVSDYTIFEIAKKLYDGKLMTNNIGHQYLYNTILLTVDPNYKATDFNWGNSVVLP